MRTTAEELPIIPVDDITLEYSSADIHAKQGVTALLSQNQSQFLLSVFDLDHFNEIGSIPGRWGEYVGFGLAAANPEYAGVLLLNAVSACTGEDTMEASEVAIAMWMNRMGREQVMKNISDVLDRLSSNGN